MRLDGRTALITGGTQGVGAAIADALAQAGCNLLLHGLQADDHSRQTQQDCQRHGVEVRCLFSDLTAPVPDCVDRILEHCDPADVPILVNNAGTFCDKPFLEMDYATFDRTFRLNVAAGYFLTQAFARRWIAQGVAGRVLFTGSINGELAEPNHTAYDSSKGAVRTLVRSLCVALAPHRIRVNSMAPGLVISPLTAPSLQPGSADLAWMQLHTPNGQVPSATACGSAALFLLSDEAEHVHGQTLMVDGGMSVWQQPDLPSHLRAQWK
ncbi:SDR family NAD(P)-dependent oxidoreductase [Aureliella helgolandensis]|uniref:Cyclopentanol dehydrogenase n=1 Tax=Aureliella helgolandensis TaxID=2527968 RepID=A0A518G6A5_9BACT|nr:SDR family oxidoreductase [Aureliella helgolandensis]QDV24113.1 Cyclopentanol dehydrogenase [Aureliella helgolandensis]